MNQNGNPLCFSFYEPPQKSQILPSPSLDKSAIFGISSPSFLSENEATPLQNLTAITEALAKIVAQTLAMEFVGTLLLKQVAIEYLNHQIQDIRKTMYNIKQQYKDKQSEFDSARSTQCLQINAIINSIKEDKFKGLLAQLLEDIKLVEIESNYSCKFQQLLETGTSFYGTFKSDMQTQKIMQQIQSESQLISKQLYVGLLCPNPTFKELLRLDIIYLTQQHPTVLRRLFKHLHQIESNEIQEELKIIQKIYPTLSKHFYDIENIIVKKENVQMISKLDIEGIYLIQLMYDKGESISKPTQEVSFQLPADLKGLLHYTVILFTEKNQQNEQIVCLIQNLLSTEEVRRNSWMLTYLAQKVMSTNLKLLLWGYSENIIEQRFFKPPCFLVEDISSLTSFMNYQPQGNFDTKEKVEKISKRQHFQFQDFMSIMKVAAELEICIQEQQKNQIREKQKQLDQQIIESVWLNELVISKEQSSLKIRNQLKQYMNMMFQTTPFQEDTFERLYKYYEQDFIIKSIIIHEPQQKPFASEINDQKRSQKWLEFQETIIKDNTSQDQQFFPVNAYQIFQTFQIAKKEQIKCFFSLKLTQFQEKFQKTFAPELQSDFVSLLKVIKNYREDQPGQFSQNVKTYYKKEFYNSFKELAQIQSENVNKVIAEIEYIHKNG